MTSFKTFLAETAVKTTPQYQAHPLDDVIKILKSKCSKSLWMISSDRPIYRGDWYVNQIPGGKEAAQKATVAFTVDTSATQRKSTNTYNFYTEIFDSHPKMKAYPKRSRSFICTTSRKTAADYASHDGTGLWRIIPFDSAKIGIVGKPDIWNVGKKVEVFNRQFEDLDGFNSLIKYLLTAVNIRSEKLDGLKKFGEMLKNPKSKAYSVLSDTIEMQKLVDYGHGTGGPRSRGVLIDAAISEEEVAALMKEISSDFMGYIYENLSPSVLGFESGAENIKKYTNSEVWVGGDIVMFGPASWKELQDRMGGEE